MKFSKAFDDHFRVPKDRHEVCIAVPSGHNVPMQVSRQPSSRLLSEVQSYIIPLWPQDAIEHSYYGLNGLDWLEQLFALELLQRANMRERSDQEMAVVIGKFIEEDGRPVPAPNDQVLLVVIAGEALAKEAAHRGVALGLPLGRVSNVLRPPGRPESIHVFVG